MTLTRDKTPFWWSFWKFPALLLLTLAVLILPYDIYHVAAGKKDGWWPFFLPVLFVVSAWAVRHYGRIIDRATPEQLERLRKELDEESCLNPKNTDRGRNPNDIG